MTRVRTCACAVADATSWPSAGAGLCRCGNPAAPSSSGRALPWNREVRPSCRASNLHARDCQLHVCTNRRDPRAATTTDLSESNSPPRACVRRPGQRGPQRSVPLAATGAPVGLPPNGGHRVLALAYTQISGKTTGLCIVSQQGKGPQCCLAASWWVQPRASLPRQRTGTTPAKRRGVCAITDASSLTAPHLRGDMCFACEAHAAARATREQGMVAGVKCISKGCSGAPRSGPRCPHTNKSYCTIPEKRAASWAQNRAAEHG